MVCDYGQILTPMTIGLARLGGINLHGSLLPKYRGAAPIQWAIYHGETETGVTVLHITPQVDASDPRPPRDADRPDRNSRRIGTASGCGSGPDAIDGKH